MQARRYETLNGLRGVAALVVALGHAPEAVSRFVPSSYLAVDLFFILSGFVLAHSYDTRLPLMGGGEFVWRRVVRLWPFYIAGLGLGAAAQLVALAGGQPDAWSPKHIGALLVAGLLLVPLRDPAGADQPLFALNSPSWSLFFELAANVAFGVGHRWLRGLALYALVAVSAAGVAASAVAYGGLDAGWNWTTFPAGAARVAFGFFLGVALYRRREVLRARWRPAPIAVLLVLPLALVAPLPTGGARVAYDIAWALVGAPGLLLLAAAREPGRGLTRLCRTLGLVSYGLYALHVPIYDLLRRIGAPLSAWQVVATLTALSAVVLLLDRAYDHPLRARLAPIYGALLTWRRTPTMPARGRQG